MANLIRKRYDLSASSENATVKDEFEMDKGATRVVGILLTADNESLLYHRGTIAVQINGEEAIPDDYAARLLMSGLGVAPKDRYLPIDFAVGNGVVKVSFSDVGNALASFDSYNVSLYLEMEMDTDDIG